VTGMAQEKVTVTITSSLGEEAPLTVGDAMRQILDVFEWLSATAGDQAGSIDWQLVDVTMQSPLTATARAVPKIPGVAAEPIARREKVAMELSLLSMVVRGEVPTGMDSIARARAKALFARNANGIGRTDIQFYENAPPITIDQKQARLAVETLEKFEKLQPEDEADLSRVEMGSLEGDVLLTGPFRGQPAIQLRERLSGLDVWCIFSPELAEQVGPQHSWEETWENRRVLVTGRITYSRDGRIRHVYAIALEDIDPRSLSYGDIADPNFTGGLAPSAYLESLWEEEDVG
jgi:hypothetical protein